MEIIEESPEFRKFDRIINQSSSWTPEEKQQARTDLVDSIKVACITALLSLLMFSPAIGLAIGAGIIAASLFVLIRMMQTPDPLLALHDKIGKTIEESIPSPKDNVEMTLVKPL